MSFAKDYSWARALVIVTLVSLVVGCATPTRRPAAATVRVETPPAAPKLSIDTSSRQQFDEALEALRAGDIERAEQQLLSLHQAKPDLSGPAANLGLIEFKRGNFDASIAYLEKAVIANPRNVPARNLLGVAYRESGRFDEAVKAYATALSVDADYAPAHRNLGIMYDLYLGKLRDATVHYERYQQLVETPDPQVEIWIASVKRRLDAE